MYINAIFIAAKTDGNKILFINQYIIIDLNLLIIFI